MVILLTGALATSVLFTTDAFFAFAGWRILVKKQTWGRDCVRRLHAFTEKREPIFAAVALACTAILAAQAGIAHPRCAFLAGGAAMALGAHLLVYVRTACLMQGFEGAPIGSAEWHASAGKLEAAMVTRASLQAAAFICVIAAGLLS